MRCGVGGAARARTGRPGRRGGGRFEDARPFVDIPIVPPACSLGAMMEASCASEGRAHLTRRGCQDSVSKVPLGRWLGTKSAEIRASRETFTRNGQPLGTTILTKARSRQAFTGRRVSPCRALWRPRPRTSQGNAAPIFCVLSWKKRSTTN